MRRCNDQRVAGVAARIADQLERFLLQFGGVDVVENDLRVETLGMLLETLPSVPGLAPHCGSAGQLSTSVVVISWPPCASPVISTGLRLARAAYTAAVYPAGPEPRMMSG